MRKFGLNPVVRFVCRMMLTCCWLLVFLAPWRAHAQAEITVVMSGDSTPYQQLLLGFKNHMRAIGVQAVYRVHTVEGEFALEQQVSDQAMAAVIYCLGTRACHIAREVSPTKPLVASLLLTPEAIAGLQATGVFFNYLPETQLRWLKEAFPQFRRIGVMFNPEENQAWVDEASRVAQQLGQEIMAAPVDAPKALPATLKSLLRTVDVLWTIPDKTVLAPQSAKELLLSSFRQRVPVIGASPPWVKSGALYSLDWDYLHIGAQNAAAANRILSGEATESIPIIEPGGVAYSLNMKTARHMKLDISSDIIAGAKHVFQ